MQQTLALNGLVEPVAPCDNLGDTEGLLNNHQAGFSEQPSSLPSNFISSKDTLKKHRIKPLILLAEDDKVVQFIHQKYLEMLQCDVLLAGDGAQAMDLAKHQPDLFLLDIGLPKVGGLAVGRFVRDHALLSDTPIIALTGYGDEVTDECHKAGINEVLVKPVSREALKQRLKNWLPRYHSIFA